MEENVGELENKASGKFYLVKWDKEKEISFVQTKQYIWVPVDENVKTAEDALKRAEEHLRDNQDLY